VPHFWRGRLLLRKGNAQKANENFSTAMRWQLGNEFGLLHWMGEAIKMLDKK
jgi:hypothetical protein